MGQRIDGGLGRFELIAGRERRAGRSTVQFLDRDEALRFLRRVSADPYDMACIRTWAHQEGLEPAPDQGVLEQIAAGLDTGDFHVARPGSAGGSAKGGGSTPTVPKPKEKPKPKKPKPKVPEKVTELVVTVKDSDGKPVEGATVTAGAIGSKKTNKEGIADFGKVKPGSYDITAEKPGHAPKRNDPVGKDEKKAVAVPEGSRTSVDLVQHPDCANVSFFEGSTTRANYFGFDHKTNIVAAANGEYWKPVPDKGTLTMPAFTNITRDATRWVSVAVGKETEVEINFDFKGTECIPCIANSTFKVIPADKAEVVTATITAKKAKFKIKGKAVGEASLKVICDGKDIGWFHIWCEVEKELLLDVACIVTTRAAASAYSLGGMTTYLNDIYRQQLVKLNLKDLGIIDLSANAPLAVIEATEYPVAGGKFQQGTSGATDTAALTAMDLAAIASVAARTTGASARAGARRLYWYIPTAGAAWGGENVSIGHPATFVYFADGLAARNTCAHEIGHSMKLKHPSDGSGAAQFAPHNLATLNNASPAYTETNTEPASGTNPKHSNVMANDPTNLMGYWPIKASRKYLRYHQWKAADRS